MSYISLKGVSYSYPLGEGRSIKALKNLSLTVEKGSFVALVGRNGSGKSTLAKLLNGLFIPTSGDVEIDGINTKESERIFEIRMKAGMVFQNPDNQTVATIVEDDVAFGPENIGVPREEIVDRVDWALKAVGMEDFAKRTASKLSGGQKQRVAIAGVLAMKPEIIIFDESTSMLDPSGRKEIMKIAKKLNAEGATVINITHSMEEAALADRVVVMSRGAIVMDGSPKEIFTSEEIGKYGLSLPTFTSIAFSLSEVGYSFEGAVTSSEELAEGIWRQLK